jgi:putative nucleotidyltransferase with HDIG domain
MKAYPGSSNIEKQIRADIKAFPAMPAMCQTLMTKFSDPEADFGSLAEEMKYDPGMTANVLKLANSAAFSSGMQLDSLKTAFVRLGMKTLFQLVAAQASAPMLKQTLIGYYLRPEELLRHSVWTAVASEEIAVTLKLDAPELLFTAGLLHDMGKVILDGFILLNGTAISTAMHATNETFDSIESSILGLSHAEAGAEIMKQWRFPDELVATIRWHHDPSQAGVHSPIVDIVHLADMLAYTEGIGTGIDGLRYKVSENAVSELGITTRTLERAASHTLDKMNELERILT